MIFPSNSVIEEEEDVVTFIAGYNKTNNVFSIGWAPFFGYHHLLMLFIAAAIILLCKLFITLAHTNYLLTYPPASTAPSRLILLLPRHPQHLPHLLLLLLLHTHLQSNTSRSGHCHRHRQHRRHRASRSSSRLLWHMHECGWRELVVQ